MTTPDNRKWMVAMFGKVLLKNQISRSEVVELPDPATKHPRPYVLACNSSGATSCQSIAEVHALPADFSSFFVGRHVVKDGNLYVLNQVDPLFFIVATLVDVTESKKAPWRPFDQIIAQLPKPLQSCVSESQLVHICQTFCSDQTDNVKFYKFSVAKAFSWLQRKQEKVFQCLVLQENTRRSQESQRLASQLSTGGTTHGGSVSATFHMPDDPQIVAPVSQESTQDDTILSSAVLNKLKMESLQVVCNYLPDAWILKFLENQNYTREQVFGQQKKKATSTTPAHSSQATASSQSEKVPEVTPKPKKKLEAARSVGNKRLEKISKRGMTSLTSFFGPAKKAKKGQ